MTLRASTAALGLALAAMLASPAAATAPEQARIVLEPGAGGTVSEHRIAAAVRDLCERPHIASVRAMSEWNACRIDNRAAIAAALAAARA